MNIKQISAVSIFDRKMESPWFDNELLSFDAI